MIVPAEAFICFGMEIQLMMFKEVTLTGTPYERGLKYGQTCKEEIAISVRNYRDL